MHTTCLTYASVFPLVHRLQITCHHPVLSCPAASVFLHLYLKPTVHIFTGLFPKFTFFTFFLCYLAVSTLVCYCCCHCFSAYLQSSSIFFLACPAQSSFRPETYMVHNNPIQSAQVIQKLHWKVFYVTHIPGWLDGGECVLSERDVFQDVGHTTAACFGGWSPAWPVHSGNWLCRRLSGKPHAHTTSDSVGVRHCQSG